MEEVKRIYSLLFRNRGLKIRDISRELNLDRYYVAEIMFSTDNIPYWYQDEDSLWYAREGAIAIDEKKEETVEYLESPKQFNIDRFLKYKISNSLRSYLNRVEHFRLYSNKDVIELFKLYRGGNKKAYELIVESQQRLVANLSLLYYKNGMQLEDLIQEGNIGLMRAIERFDYNNFRDFSGYAKNWILQSLSLYATYAPYIIRLPLNQLSAYNKIKRYAEKFEQENGFRPSPNEVEIGEDINTDRISELLKLPDNLRELVTTNYELDSLYSVLPPTDVFQEVEYNIYKVHRLLRILRDRESNIVELYYGIGTNTEGMSLAEVGATFYLTRERARQIVVKSIEKIQKSKRIKSIDRQWAKKSIDKHWANIGEGIQLDESKQSDKSDKRRSHHYNKVERKKVVSRSLNRPPKREEEDINNSYDDRHFDLMYNKFIEYIKKNKHIPLSTIEPDMYNWYNYCRMSYDKFVGNRLKKTIRMFRYMISLGIKI